MAQPFFSIIIPTKNRPDLLRDAIFSVLNQDFNDYELIVSDNFNDERTKEIADGFFDNPHLKYFRTDRELNMPDHWEFANQKTSGRYIMMLSDRSVLCNGALKKIRKIIQDSPEDVEMYTWQHIVFEKREKFLRATAKLQKGVRIFTGAELLKEYEDTQKMDARYPVCLNCCWKAELAKEAIAKYKRLFGPVSPDVIGGFTLLSCAEKLAHVDEPLFVMQGTEDSNGRLRDWFGPEFYLRTLDMENLYRHVPIAAPFIHNLAMDDYLSVRAKITGSSNLSGVNWSTYFIRCYEEFVYFKRSGFIAKTRNEYFNAWKSALSKFESKVQNKVKRSMKLADIKFGLKAFLAKIPFLQMLRKVQNHTVYNYPNKHYATVLEAAGFKR